VPYVLSYGAPVRKTSVYLPDALKRRLAAAAESAHRSEADLVREAIEQRMTAGSAPAADGADAPVPGRLVGVGVGPQRPHGQQVGRARALRRATVVVAPCTDPSAIGRAEAIVREAAPDVVVERLVFVMAPAQAERAEALDAASARVVELLDAGEEVAFITLGDPNVYSTFSSVASAVRAARPSSPVVTVPGVMAFQELAARADLVLTDEQQTLVVLPANSSDTALDAALDDPTRTIVLYKGGRRLPDIAERLDATDRIDGAVLGELLGMPGERIAHVADVADRPASYLSAVIVPAKEGA